MRTSAAALYDRMEDEGRFYERCAKQLDDAICDANRTLRAAVESTCADCARILDTLDTCARRVRDQGSAADSRSAAHADDTAFGAQAHAVQLRAFARVSGTALLVAHVLRHAPTTTPARTLCALRRPVHNWMRIGFLPEVINFGAALMLREHQWHRLSETFAKPTYVRADAVTVVLSEPYDHHDKLEYRIVRVHSRGIEYDISFVSSRTLVSFEVCVHSHPIVRQQIRNTWILSQWNLSQIMQ